MTDIHHRNDVESPPSDSGADYQKSMRVEASADALFDALTDVAGLTAWWTRATGTADAGGQIEFWFDPPQPCVMRVDQAVRPDLVQWTVTSCDFLPDWVGTRPTFTITQLDGDECELEFVHHGLTPELDCIEMCTRGWDHFIPSLRDHVESGHGRPHGSEADRARHRPQAAARNSASSSS